MHVARATVASLVRVAWATALFAPTAGCDRDKPCAGAASVGSEPSVSTDAQPNVVVRGASVLINDRVVAPKPAGGEPAKIDALYDALWRRRQVAKALSEAPMPPMVSMPADEPPVVFLSVAGTTALAFSAFAVHTRNGAVTVGLELPPDIGGGDRQPWLRSLRALSAYVGKGSLTLVWRLGWCTLEVSHISEITAGLASRLSTELAEHGSVGVAKTPFVVVSLPDATFGILSEVLSASAKLPFARIASTKPARSAPTERSPEDCVRWPITKEEGALPLRAPRGLSLPRAGPFKPYTRLFVEGPALSPDHRGEGLETGRVRSERSDVRVRLLVALSLLGRILLLGSLIRMRGPQATPRGG